MVLDRLRVLGRQRDSGLFTSLDGAELLERSPGLLKIAVPSAFHRQRLQNRIAEVNAVCGEIFGTPTRVDLTLPGEVAEQPEASQSANGRELERRRRREALNHPSVNLALEVLAAEIVEIRPLGGK